MADVLKTRVESLEAVPEAYRGAYEEQDGKYVLNTEADGDFELIDSSPLKGKLSTLRKRADDLQGRLGELDKFEGLDPDAAREALEKVKNWDGENLDFNEEMQRKLKSQKDQMAAKFQEELGKASARSEKLTGKLTRTLVDNAAIIAIKELEGDAELLLPHVRSRVHVIEENDDFKPVVLDELGEPAYDGEGNNVSIKSYVKGLQKKFPGAFKGAGSTGSGSKAGGAAAPGPKEMPRSQFEKLGPTEQMAFVKSGGKPIDG